MFQDNLLHYNLKNIDIKLFVLFLQKYILTVKIKNKQNLKTKIHLISKFKKLIIKFNYKI